MRIRRVKSHTRLLLRLAPPTLQSEPRMAARRPIRVPSQWPKHIKSGILHAIWLASVVLTVARGRAKVRRRLRAELDQAQAEIALLREELIIKDGRWERSHSRRRPHYTPIQRMRIAWSASVAGLPTMSLNLSGDAVVLSPGIQGTHGTSTARPFRRERVSGCRGFRSRCLSVGRFAGGSPLIRGRESA